MNGEVFGDWVEQVLEATLSKGDIVIFDNLHVHKEGPERAVQPVYAVIPHDTSHFKLRVDGLEGFPYAIASFFPRCEVQRCIIHQICNFMHSIASEDQKAVMADLKLIYLTAG